MKNLGKEKMVEKKASKKPTLREGNIYRWRWTEAKAKQLQDAGWSLYHCHCQIAIVRNKRLIDDYWGISPTDKSYLDSSFDRNEIELEYLGNFRYLRKVNRYEARYYKPSDIVDLTHRNSYGNQIYVKKSAKRSITQMHKCLIRMLDRAQSDLDYAQRRIQNIQDNIANLTVESTLPSYDL